MAFLGNIFGNATIQNMALAKLKSTMLENKICAVVVRIDEYGEFAFSMETEPGRYIPESDMQVLLDNSIKLIELENELLNERKTIKHADDKNA